MTDQKKAPAEIEAYIQKFPAEVQSHLRKIRDIIHDAAPEATEAFSYQIPTFQLNGNLVHFGAFKNHIGFYPGPSGIAAFAKELSEYENSKGAVKFPFDREMPADLITRIVKFRVNENLQKKRK